MYIVIRTSTHTHTLTYTLLLYMHGRNETEIHNKHTVSHTYTNTCGCAYVFTIYLQTHTKFCIEYINNDRKRFPSLIFMSNSLLGYYAMRI